MLAATLVIHLLDGMFFLGLAGSTVVVVISFFEDAHELLGEDEPTQPHANPGA